MSQKFSYEIKGGIKHGYFNISQAKNGAILLNIGGNILPLTENQINKLSIYVYELIDFNHDSYKAHYQKQPGQQP